MVNDCSETRIEDHLPRMYRVALRIVGNPDEAEDVVQDACVKSLRGWDGFHGQCALITWLHRITVNCARDHLRRRRRGDKVGRMEDPSTIAIDERVAAPGSSVDSGALCDRVREMVNRLPDDCRAAFIMTQLDGYRYDAAASLLKLPRGTVASRVFRAKRLLLEQLGDQIDEVVQ